MEDLHSHGVLPQRIDRSVLNRFSGGVGNQLMTALRFLGLVDADDRPTDSLRSLVDAFGSDEQWQAALQAVIREAYVPVVAVGLESATPAQFVEAFRTYPGTEEVRRKSEVFFLNAAKDAGLPLTKRIADQKRVVVNAMRRRKLERPDPERSEDAADDPPGNGNGGAPRQQPERSSKRQPPPPPPPPNPTPAQPDMLGQLVAKFPEFDPTWPEEVKAKWFDGFERLMGAISPRKD